MGDVRRINFRSGMGKIGSPESELPAMTRLRDNFTNQEEGVPVDEYARQIAGAVNKMKTNREKVTVIEDALRDRKIFNAYEDYLRKNYTREERQSPDFRLDDSEILQALSNIKRAILDKLLNYLEPGEFYFSAKDFYSPVNRVAELDGLNYGYQQKEKAVYRENRAILSDSAVEAIKKCMTLGKSEHIVDIKYFDEKNKTAVVEYKENFKTLNDLLITWRNFPDRYNLSYILNVLVGNLKGANFLAENGMVMQDICPPNCGDNNGEGVLFDIDGLVLAGATIRSRSSHDGYYPPVQYDRSTPVLPKEMTFQFGACLKDILKSVESVDPRTYRNELFELDLLANEMEKDLETNNSLTEHIRSLESILERVRTIDERESKKQEES